MLPIGDTSSTQPGLELGSHRSTFATILLGSSATIAWIQSRSKLPAHLASAFAFADDLPVCRRQLLKRTIRVDHVRDYKPPKDNEDLDEITRRLHEEGVAPRTPSPTPAEREPEPEPDVKPSSSSHKG